MLPNPATMSKVFSSLSSTNQDSLLKLHQYKQTLLLASPIENIPDQLSSPKSTTLGLRYLLQTFVCPMFEQLHIGSSLKCKQKDNKDRPQVADMQPVISAQQGCHITGSDLYIQVYQEQLACKPLISTQSTWGLVVVLPYSQPYIGASQTIQCTLGNLGGITSAANWNVQSPYFEEQVLQC